MENQHRKISGYRELTQTEIDLMNEIKAKGEELRALIAKVDANISQEDRDKAYQVPIHEEADNPVYFLRFADGTFRTALMYLVRAVAKPTTY